MIKARFFLIIALIFTLAACNITPKAKNDSLIGAWKVNKVIWKNGEKSAEIEKAQPGVFIFTDRHYSLQWTPTQKPRTPFKILSKPTDEEAISGFKSVVFNAGSYKITEKGLTSTAVIAKVPGFEGGQQIYTLKWQQELLYLTMVDEVYPDGSKPQWSGKVTTTFVLEKL